MVVCPWRRQRCAGQTPLVASSNHFHREAFFCNQERELIHPSELNQTSHHHDIVCGMGSQGCR